MSPSGIKTWLPTEVKKQNQITSKLIDLFESYSYEPILIPTLVDINIIEKANSKFTSEYFKLVDRDGKTLALRTELTQPIAKAISTRASELKFPQKLYYNSSIFRYRGIATDDSREIQQIGIECIGSNDDREIIKLLLASLELLKLEDYTITITTAKIWEKIFEIYGKPNLSMQEELELKDSQTLASQVYRSLLLGDLLAFRNLSRDDHQLQSLLESSPEAIEKAFDLDLSDIKFYLSLSNKIKFDPLQTPELKLYTGIHFNVISKNEGKLLALGGRYDRLCKSFGADLEAIGFAFYLPRLISAMESEKSQKKRGHTLKIAVSKGTLFEGAVAFLQSQGIAIEDISNKRKLILSAKSAQDLGYKDIEILMVRGHDVPIYVDHGAADLGIVGIDVVIDSKTNVMKLRDLNYGHCRLSVCAIQGQYKSVADLPSYTRVATTFPNIAKDFFEKRGLEVEIINLYGSVELGPLTALSDVIVDLVATGTTLKENGLEVLEDIMDCTSILIANPSSFKANSKLLDLC